MKKWMVIAIAMVLAGCGDVSVEGEVDGDGAQTEGCKINEDCTHNNLEKICDVEHKKCVQCIDSDCPNGEECQNNVCVKTNSAISEECDDSESGNCKGGKCVDNICIKYECEQPKYECKENKAVLKCHDEANEQELFECEHYCVIDDNDKPKCIECDSEHVCEKGKCNEENRCADDDGSDDPECQNSFDCRTNLHNPICRDGQCDACNNNEECQEIDENFVCSLEGVCLEEQVPPACLTYSSKCTGEDELIIKCDDDEHKVKCKCKPETEDRDWCIDKPECEYVWGCDGDTAINLYCRNEEGSQGTEKQMEESIKCGIGEVCSDGKCKQITDVGYTCDDIDMIRVEVEERLKQLGVLNEELLNNCMSGVVKSEAEIKEWNKTNKCLIVCGNIEIKGNDNFSPIELESGSYVIGVNKAGIESSKALIAPLFGKLENVTIMNLKLDYNLILSEHSRGMLSNSSENQTIIKGVEVKNKILEYKYDGETNLFISDIGLLIGKSVNTSILESIIENCTISLTGNNECKHNDQGRFTNIGGVVGSANSVILQNVKLKNITINADKGAYVGGMVGKANNVTIKGGYGISETDKNIKDIEGISITNAERDAGGLLGNIWGDFYISNINASISAVTTNLPCAGGLIGYASDGRDDYFNTIKDVNLNVGTINAGKYAGGVVGLFSNTNLRIDNVENNVDTVESKKYECNDERDPEKDGLYAGGLIGGMRNNAILEIDNLNNTFENINTESYSGGILGGVSEGTGSIIIRDVITGGKNVFSQSNYTGGLIAEIKSDSDSKVEINRIKNTVDNVIANNEYSGGLIGAIQSNIELSIVSVENLFGQIKSNKYAGGIFSYNSKDAIIDMSDIINRSFDRGIEANNYIGGLVGYLNYDKEFKVNNIVNEITMIKSSGIAGGLFGAMSVSNIDTIPFDISAIISNVSITHSDLDNEINSVGGAIGYLQFQKLADSSNLHKFHDSLIKSRFNDNKNHVSGIINAMARLRDNENSIANRFLPDGKYKYVRFFNILADNNLDNSSVIRNAYYESINKSALNSCPTTTDETYAIIKEEANNPKNIIYKIFSNVYYSTPGSEIDPHVTAALALSWCNDNNSRNDDEPQCGYHRDYRYPVYYCWFTDYIYHKNFKTPSDLVSTDIPIKPYHPYSQEMNKSESYNTLYHVGLDDSKSPSPLNNKSAILLELNNDNVRWQKCSNITKLSDLVNKLSDFDNLLCPLLTGKITCMGKWDDTKNECILSEKLTCIGEWDDVNQKCKTE